MATKLCPVCGVEFGHGRPPYYLRDRTYCSSKCFSTAHLGANHPAYKTRQDKSCVECGKPIRERKGSYTEFAEALFCSRGCANKHNNSQREFRKRIPCPICEKLFKPRKTYIGVQEVCSWGCRAKYDNFHHPTSSLERKLHDILNVLNVKYEPQVEIKTRFIVDIRIGNLIIEADGDYWHGHPSLATLTTKQLTQQKRDRQRDNYLLKRGYAILRIWERDMSLPYVRQKLIEFGILSP